jgi:Cu-Zn family superoxide dismutase
MTKSRLEPGSRSGLYILAAGLVLAAAPSLAQPKPQQPELRTKVEMKLIDDKGTGASIGSVTFIDTPQGLAIEPGLAKLPPGPHGFHVHENPDCGPKEQDGKMVPGLAAGAHYDPGHTKAHRGPQHTDGHRGDLPRLVVEKDGTSMAKMLAPHLKIADLKGRSLIIHADGDNYADTPKPLGGGGGRIACGVFDIKMAQ